MSTTNNSGLYDTIRKFAKEDAEEICTWIKENIGQEATHSDVMLDKTRRQVDLAMDDVGVTATCSFTVGDKTVETSWEYATNDADIFVDATTKDVAAAVVEQLSKIDSSTSVNASTQVQASVPIRAADDDDVFNMDGADDFDPNFDPAAGDDAGGDGIVIDDDQDDANPDDHTERPKDEFGNEIEEDDDNLDANNNIENHFIAECDLCHGIFISAMVESDQLVETITGTCPLCGKKSDQYLKWVIRPVEKQIEERSY